MADWTEVRDALERAEREHPHAAAVSDLQARAHRHLADRFGRLLTLDEWSAYRALVQERINAGEAMLAQARDEIETAVGDEREKKALQIQRIRGQLEAYIDALTFPSQVIAQVPQEAAPSPA